MNVGLVDRPVDAEPAGDALRERRLARPEVADEHDDVAGFEVRGERGRDRVRVSSADAVWRITTGARA